MIILVWRTDWKGTKLETWKVIRKESVEVTHVGNDSGLTAALSMENRCIRYSQEVELSRLVH